MNKKILIDIIMLICVLCAISYRIVGGIYHEIIGLTFLSFFVIHNILNIKWYKNIKAGKYNRLRFIITVLNILLIICTIILITTGIMHSKEIFGFATDEDSISASWKVHALFAYWFFVLASIHLGIYCHTILIKIPVYKNKKFIILGRIFFLITALIGIKEFMDRNIGSKLILYYSFDFWHTSEPLYSYIASYISIMCLFAFVTYYLIRIKKLGSKK